MPTDLLTCPHCGKQIPLSQALRQQLKNEVAKDLNKELEKQAGRHENEIKQLQGLPVGNMREQRR